MGGAYNPRRREGWREGGGGEVGERASGLEGGLKGSREAGRDAIEMRLHIGINKDRDEPAYSYQ